MSGLFGIILLFSNWNYLYSYIINRPKSFVTPVFYFRYHVIRINFFLYVKCLHAECLSYDATLKVFVCFRTWSLASADVILLHENSHLGYRKMLVSGMLQTVMIYESETILFCEKRSEINIHLLSMLMSPFCFFPGTHWDKNSLSSIRSHFPTCRSQTVCYHRTRST